MKLKRDLKLCLSFFGLAALVACSTPAKEESTAVPEGGMKKAVDAFEAANVLLDSKRYEDAAKAFDKLRVETPATTLDFFVLLNSGIAYQSMGDCKTAADRYKTTVRVTNNKNPQTQAMARLRLSDVLSCEGNDRLAIINLVELYKNRRYLPVEVAEAEVPARLAAAYARAGNKKTAEKYFKDAEEGFRKVSSQNKLAGQRPTLAKTLFLMGNMSHLDPMKISGEDYFVSVDSLQGYLFRAVEMDVDNWSDLSMDQLQEAYQKVWLFIDREGRSNETAPDLADRAVRLEKIKAARSALATMKELTNMYVPGKKPNKRMTELFGSLDKTARQIEGYLAMNRVGNDLTNEAKRAKDVKQEGRLVDPKKR